MRRLTLLSLLVVSSCSYADDVATKNLNALLAKMTSMQAHFEQHTLDPKNQPLQTLSGEMQVKRPGFFRGIPLNRLPSKSLPMHKRYGFMILSCNKPPNKN